MDILTPNAGTIFWTTLAFLILLFILGKYAWKPIMNAIKERELRIEKALRSAEKAKEEIESLRKENELILKRAKEERDKILSETMLIKEQIIKEAKEKAEEEAKVMILNARKAIKEEKEKAYNEIKEQIVNLSIEIAEKILRQKLQEEEKQKLFIDNSLKNLKMN